MRKLTALLLACVCLCGTLFAQKQVTGKVTDAKDGAPLAGVSVKVKGSSTGTSTGPDGSYTITLPDGGKTLVFSYIGFGDKEVSAAGNTAAVVLTQNSATNLSEVVVVGYGTNVKKDLTGNIARVKGADIQSMPVPNFTQALQGRAAGVFVEANNGKVGEGVKIRIRGAGSISASNDPLYVIDGIPISNSALSGNAMADINFNDIETFDILKDAAATAIYGSRGANGVVVITTKKGKSGKTTFQVNSQYGSNKPTHLRGFLNAKEYVDLLREAAINSDLALGYDPTDPANYPDSYLEYAELTLDDISGGTDWKTYQTNTNWEKLAFNDKAHTSAIDLSASGGNEKTKFYFSGSYSGQDGILIANDFKRLSGRINVEHEVNSRLKFAANLSLTQTKVGRVGEDNEFSTPMQIVALSPVTPVYDADGNLNNSPVTTYANPMVDAAEGYLRSKVYRNIGNISGTYKIFPSLSFISEFGLDVQNSNDDAYYGPNTVNGSGTSGYGSSSWYQSTNYNTNNYFNFIKTLGQDHNLNVVAGMSYQDYSNEYATVYGQDFPVEALKKLASAGEITGGTSTSSASSFVSYFGRVNYKFSSKYLLGLSGRIDGSSRFGANNRYGFFPAVSAGWVISEENFLKNSNLLSFLKLRASYGVAGNADGFGDFQALGLWGGTRYGGSSGLTTTQLANEKLKWERSKQLDIGIEFGLFGGGRISGEIDYYQKKTTDLIYSVPVPSNSGFTTQTVNVGSMENKGFEFVLNTRNVAGKNFSWNTSLNVSLNKNKITNLDGAQSIIPGNDGRFLNSLLVGESIGVFYGPKFAGADPQTGDALYYEADGKTTTNSYNSAGNFVVGNPNPDVIAGITNTVQFKGLELSFLFQGVFGNQIMNGAGGFMSASFDYFDNQTRETLDRWQNPGDITNVPQLRLLGGNGTGASSRYIYDGDYVRLKNATLAYNFPSTLTKKMRINSLRAYITGVNLLTFTGYPGWDPEVNTDYRAGNRNQGADFYAAPQIRNISFGLNLGF